MLLMSLALDGLLDADEEQCLQRALAEHPLLAARWQSWQALDSDLHATPMASPPRDFVAAVALRIEVAERRRRLWLGVAVGVATALLWCTVLVAAASAGAFVLLNQSGWLSDFVRTLAYGSAAISSWIDSLLRSLGTVLGTPQARSFILAYGLAAAGILIGWVHLLRRTTRMPDVVAAQ
jgi:hypothetical protein